MNKKNNLIILAYSGGLDTSVMLKWLIEMGDFEVITYTANLGQIDIPDLMKLKQKALEAGASKAIIEDLREEFIKEYVFPVLRNNAIYEEQYLLGTAISRPIIAKRQMEIAKIEKAAAVSHGSTGKGNDQIRFELGYLFFNPNIKIVVPWRKWSLNSRTELIKFAKERGIKIDSTISNLYSIDSNILNTSYEGGILENPAIPHPKDMFLMTTSPETALNKPEEIEIGFERGDPFSVNGDKIDCITLMNKLNKLGREHGIGRIDIVENTINGMKSRVVYDTPGGIILRTAHIALESITLTKEIIRFRNSLISRYSDLIYDGLWFSKEREVLQKTMDNVQENVNGNIILKLYKGNCSVLSRSSQNSIYDANSMTSEENSDFETSAVEGFIKFNASKLRS